MKDVSMKRVLFYGAGLVFLVFAVGILHAQTVISSPPQSGSGSGTIDFAGAKPMPQPQLTSPPVAASDAAPAHAGAAMSPGVESGSNSGDGRLNPVQLVPASRFQQIKQRYSCYANRPAASRDEAGWNDQTAFFIGSGTNVPIRLEVVTMTTTPHRTAKIGAPVSPTLISRRSQEPLSLRKLPRAAVVKAEELYSRRWARARRRAHSDPQRVAIRRLQLLRATLARRRAQDCRCGPRRNLRSAGRRGRGSIARLWHVQRARKTRPYGT